jgi:hypothetical protein
MAGGEQMSARDELTTIAHDAMFPGGWREDRMTWPPSLLAIADAILAAGYSKPRTIESIGAIAQREGMVLLITGGRVMLFKRGHWHSPGSMVWWSPMVEWLPATVLYEPAP